MLGVVRALVVDRRRDHLILQPDVAGGHGLYFGVTGQGQGAVQLQLGTIVLHLAGLPVEHLGQVGRRIKDRDVDLAPHPAAFVLVGHGDQLFVHRQVALGHDDPTAGLGSPQNPITERLVHGHVARHHHLSR
ncbi:hypothetical protein D3C81_1152460 [compost metagenome]